MWIWHNFAPSEFPKSKLMDPILMKSLDRTRDRSQTIMVVNSSYRPIPHDKSWSNSAHYIQPDKTVKGVDIEVVDSVSRFKILEAAFYHGFKRIGIYDLHIHLDKAPSPFAQGVCWQGKSK